MAMESSAREAVVVPIGGGDAHAHRLVLRPRGAHRFEHFEREAQAVFDAAAVFVGALVADRREEGREQIAVAAMQFEHVEAGFLAHQRGADEIGFDAVHVGARHFARRGVGVRTRRCGEGAMISQLPVSSG